MKQVLSHLNLIYGLKNRCMELTLASQYQDRIPEVFEEADEIGLDLSQFKDCRNIQQTLLEASGSTAMFKRLREAGIHSITIEAFLDTMPGLQVMKYPVEHVIEVLQDSMFYVKSCCPYLEYFSGLHLTEAQRKTVAEHLNYLLQTHYRDGLCLDAFSEPELRLFYDPVFDIIPTEYLKQTAALLISDAALKHIMQKLIEHDVLRIDYEILCHIHTYSQRAETALEKVLSILKGNKTAQTDFLMRWLENGALEYDLGVLETKLPELNGFENLFSNRAGYINLVFGQKFEGIPLSELSGGKEALIIYGITNHKKAFLKLVEENFTSILEMSSHSILFDPYFRKVVNLNTLNQKDLLECEHLLTQRWNTDVLEGHTYSFPEIRQLFGLPDQYIKLYHKLSVPRLDDKLLILKQMAKKKLLNGITDTEIDILAEKLSVKNIYAWVQEDFSHIKGITPANAVRLLCAYEELKILLPTIQTQTELLYVLRNREAVLSYTAMQDVKRDLLQLDKAWLELRNVMNIEDKFINAHAQGITEFLFRNGADIALTYYQQLSDEKQAAYRRIVIAELMGEFHKLKYFKDDLLKEIGYPISNSQQKAWEKALTLEKDGFAVQEHDGFFETMQLGEVPQHTCMSYINGSYNYCLLSNFDSNKHVIYVYQGDKPVARALLRLTKGKFWGAKSSDYEQPGLQFADLENLPDAAEPSSENEENLTLFLERSYTAGISDEVAVQTKKLLIKLAEKKAEELGCKLVLSKFYCNEAKEYFMTKYFLYISCSKAGEQYFDSLSGESSVSEEGSYKCSSFLMNEKKALNKL